MKSLLIIIFTITVFAIGVSQNGQFEEAIQLSHQGKYEQAEQVFFALDTKDVTVQLKRAYNFSWWGKYEKAEELFKSLIVSNPEHTEAYVGIGYNNTWKGSFANAVQYYNKAILLDPQNKSAYYGLAHNYLSSLNAEGLSFALNRIEANFPADAEYYYLLGKMHALKMENRKAKIAFKSGLTLDPGNTLIKEQLRTYESAPKKLFITGWYGLSDVKEARNHTFRRLDLGYNFSDRMHLYGGFDNSLIMQNTFLRTLEGNAPYYFGGLKYGVVPKWHLKAEIGYRTFTSMPNQLLLSIENIFFAHSAVTVSTFHLIDDRSTEMFVGNGVTTEMKWAPEFRTAISYFRNDNLNIQNNGNQRILFVPKFNYKNIALDLGMYYDWAMAAEETSQHLTGYFGLLTIPLVNHFELRLLYQEELVSSGIGNDMFSLGLTYKI